MNGFFTPQEVADKLRVDVKTVYRWLKAGHLKARRYGLQYRITQEDIDAFADGHGAGGGDTQNHKDVGESATDAPHHAHNYIQRRMKDAAS